MPKARPAIITTNTKRPRKNPARICMAASQVVGATSQPSSVIGIEPGRLARLGRSLVGLEFGAPGIAGFRAVTGSPPSRLELFRF
jgi:hypothetical protein